MHSVRAGWRSRSIRAVVVVLSLVGSPGLAAAETPRPDPAYQDAARAYRALKADPGRRKLRHNWLRVAEKFEAVARKFPRSPRAPEALFTAGQLFEDLSRISLVDADLTSAAAAYRKLVSTHPRHRLADDAALSLAKLEVERLDHPDRGLEVARRALKQLPRGDRDGELRELVAHLKQRPVTSRPAPQASQAAPDEARPRPEIVRPGTSRRIAYTAPRDAGEPTLAEQLGLKVRRVVIDPGHGGHDGGASGRHGTREKTVSLAIARKLAAILEEKGLDVVLTRTDDRFVALEERARIANRAKGDLFLSIHCNAARSSKLRGIETYTLNLSSDRYAIRLAARENSSSEKGMSDLQFILADLATKANTDESERLASQVQSHLVSSLRGRYAGVRDLGTKEALFYVLLGVKMPAVLVETSFLSHPEEERLLASPAYQSSVAEAIAQGVESFLGRRDRLAKVD